MTPRAVQIASRLRRKFMRLSQEEKEYYILGSDAVKWREVFQMADEIMELDRIMNEKVEVVKRVKRA